MGNQSTLPRFLLTEGPVHHNYQAFPFASQECSPAAETALYYGFTPVNTLKPSDIDAPAAAVVRSIDDPFFAASTNDRKRFNPEEKATLVKLYKTGAFNNLPRPLMLFYEKTARVQGKQDTFRQHCSLDIIGVPQSIAEALIIQTSHAILEEEGFKDLEVEINSSGDRGSREAFESDLIVYLRSVMNDLPPRTQEACKKNPYALFTSSDSTTDEIVENAPHPLSYLSEESRKHLREVLEYMEALGISYSINKRLIAHRSLQNHTVFRITTSSEAENGDGENEVVAAQGLRYNPLSRRLGYKKDVPAVGSYLVYKKKGGQPPSQANPSPQFCFLHLGFEAKLKSLQVINTLRRDRIPVCHCLTKDKLTGQMSTADKLKLPYLIIMGQKEALENTVLVRDMESYSQETISLDHLPSYLKRIRRKTAGRTA